MEKAFILRNMTISALRAICAAFLYVAFTLTVQAQTACSPERVTIQGTQEVRFTVEIADTDEDRARGLMFREEMGFSQGMLFIYERPQHASFWMKNTLIPLDMLFVDQTGVIQKIHQNAVPHDLTGIDGGPDVLAVLEINGGLASRLGLKAGDVMIHPAFGDLAAIPCLP